MIVVVVAGVSARGGNTTSIEVDGRFEVGLAEEGVRMPEMDRGGVVCLSRSRLQSKGSWHGPAATVAKRSRGQSCAILQTQPGAFTVGPSRDHSQLTFDKHRICTILLYIFSMEHIKHAQVTQNSHIVQVNTQLRVDSYLLSYIFDT